MDAEIAALLANLKDDDERLYRYSIEQIKQIGSVAHAAIIEIFQTADGFYALNLIFLMSELCAAVFVDTLVTVLDEKNERRLRVSAAQALGLIADKRATPALVALLKDANANMRRTATSSLGKIKDPASFDALCLALRDRELPVREEAVLALGALGDRRVIEPLKALLLRDKEVRILESAFKSLMQFGADILGFLIGLLKNKKSSLEVQRHAIICMGQLGDKRALSVLEEVLKRDEAQLMESAIEALGQIGSAEAVVMLMPLLQNGPYTSTVAKIIIKIGSDALEILLLTVATVAATTRAQIVEILGKIGDARALDTLITLLSDEDINVVFEAILALGNLGDKRAVPYLLAMLCQERYTYRAAAAQSLGQLRDKASLEALMLALMDQELKVRLAAAVALGQLRDKKAVPLLLAQLYDDDNFVIEGAIEALGEIADTWALPALRVWVRTGKPFTYSVMEQQTAKMLRKIGGTEALKVLHEYKLGAR